MINGLAIWHYPHRTMEENIRFFAACGFPSVSVHGARFVEVLADPTAAEGVAAAVAETGVILTVHYALPRKHERETVAAFEAGITAIARWQKAHGHVAVLSFDVPAPIRDNVRPYVDFVLDTVPACRVAVEDFGLTAAERAQTEHLLGHDRFGYLVDLGHLLLRLRGKNMSGKTLFTHSPDEYPVTETPDTAAVLGALRSKPHPIFEMHLHNNDGAEDLHWFLEDGVFDVPAVARALKELGYEGILTIESAPGFKFECRGQAADEGILQTYAYWQTCLGT